MLLQASAKIATAWLRGQMWIFSKCDTVFASAIWRCHLAPPSSPGREHTAPKLNLYIAPRERSCTSAPNRPNFNLFWLVLAMRMFLSCAWCANHPHRKIEFFCFSYVDHPHCISGCIRNRIANTTSEIVVSSIHSPRQLAVCICAKELKSNQKTRMQVFAMDGIEHPAIAVAVT